MFVKRKVRTYSKGIGKQRGQGLVETALLFPVLLIVLSGLIEFGFLLNEYMAIQDAARNAARFAVDGQYNADDYKNGSLVPNYDCKTTQNFYRQTGCLVNMELAQERPKVEINLGTGFDDVIVSAFSVISGGGATPIVSARFPTGEGQAGWSMGKDTPGWNKRNQSSRITTSEIASRLNSDAPSTGLVLVEVYYSYSQKLKLPWITAFVSDPVVLYTHAFMPLSSAEPTPTPIP